MIAIRRTVLVALATATAAATLAGPASAGIVVPQADDTPQFELAKKGSFDITE